MEEEDTHKSRSHTMHNEEEEDHEEEDEMEDDTVSATAGSSSSKKRKMEHIRHNIEPLQQIDLEYLLPPYLLLDEDWHSTELKQTIVKEENELSTESTSNLAEDEDNIDKREGNQDTTPVQSDDGKGDEKSKKKKSSKGSKSNNGNALSSRELRSLMTDAPPPKWKGSKGQPTTQTFEGQEELYASLDSVLTKLKNYSEHSYPFLNRVRKSDAPDYYDVIKNPMDLSLMTKKLHKCEYTSKAEFQRDLNLIFSNCRTYNTDPSSKIYLTHADAMEKKAKELMRAVKNIDFSKQKQSSSSSSQQGSPPQSVTPPDTPTMTTKAKAKSRSSTKKKGRRSKEISPPESAVNSEAEMNDKPTFQEDQSVLMTKLDVYNYWQYRSSQKSLSFSDRDAYVRHPFRMASYIEVQNQLESSTCTYDKVADDMKDFKEPDVVFCPEISYFTNSVPELRSANPPETLYYNDIIPNSVLKSTMARTSPQLKKLLGDTELELQEIDMESFPAEISIPILRKSVALVIGHAGFDGVEESVLDVLTDIASEYFFNLSKAIKIHTDLYAKKHPMIDIVSESLHDLKIGSTTLEDLYDHLTNEFKAGKMDTKLSEETQQPSQMEGITNQEEQPQSSVTNGDVTSATTDDK